MDWVFCSRKCQDAFHALYGNWQRVRDGDVDIKGVAMIDPSEIESAAMKQCLKFFGEAAGEIGFTKPLGDYSEAQALQVIEAIVTGYTEAMVLALAHSLPGSLGKLCDPLAAAIGPSASSSE